MIFTVFLCIFLYFSLSAGAANEGAPALVSLTSDGSARITLSWTASTEAVAYRIFRMTEGGTYELAGAVSGTVTSYTDTGVSDGVIYQYAIGAVNSAGESTLSNTLEGSTAYQLPEPYDIRFSEITPNGFRISGKMISSEPVTLVQIPCWTENGGQDDIVWHEASVSGDTFTLYISTSSHGSQKGCYICHIYLFTASGKRCPSPYCCSADVPENETRLSGPIVTNLTPEGYDIILFYDSVPGLKQVNVCTKASEENEAVFEKAVFSDGYIRHHINTSDHGNVTGAYESTVYAYDKSGYCDSYTFHVTVPAEAQSYLNLISVHQEHGDCTILECDGEVLLIDAGRSDEAFETVRILKALQVTHFSVLITHSHSDHFAGIYVLKENFTIDAVYMNDRVSTAYEDETSRRILKKTLTAEGIDIQPLPALGETLALSETVLQVIGPLKYYDFSYDGTTNDQSIWLSGTHGTKKFLLCGDTESEVEADMVASETDLQADFVKVSHHGCGTSSTADFTNAVQASVGVIEGGVLSIASRGTNVEMNYSGAGTVLYDTEVHRTLSFQFAGDTLTTRYHYTSPVLSFYVTGDPENPNKVLYGDVNKDGTWDVRDIAYLRGHILGNNYLTGDKFEAADINGDGNVDVRDIAYLRAYILKNSDRVKQR